MVADAREPEVEFLDHKQGWELLEEHAQRYLHLSAREFIDAWDAGTVQDPDRPEVMRVAMLLPLVR